MNDCLKNAQGSLCIQSVNLKGSKIFVRDKVDFPTLDRDKTVTQNFRGVSKIKQISFNESGGEDFWEYRFVYIVGSRLIFSDEKEDSSKEAYEPIMEIVGIFEAIYLSKKQINDEALKDYSTDNVGYHVWPYWREYVQSSCSRIGFSPVIAVPVYII